MKGLVGSMPLQFLEIGFHVEIHAIEWHDFQHETQFHGSCSGMNRIFSLFKSLSSSQLGQTNSESTPGLSKGKTRMG